MLRTIRKGRHKMATKKMSITNKNMCRFKMQVTVLMLVGVVAGCSSIPDGINPLVWFDSSLELFTSEDPKVSTKTAEKVTQKRFDAISDTLTKFPKLSNVDQQKKRSVLRDKGLAADEKGRKYAPTIARQGEATNTLSSAPIRPSEITAATVPATQPKTPELAVLPPDVTNPLETKPTISKNVSGQVDFQTRFANRLSEIRAEAAKGNQLSQNIVPVLNQLSLGTVVVSSAGTESNYGVPANKYQLSANTYNSKVTYLAKPMSPLSDNVVRVATIRFNNGSAKLSSRDRLILANVIRLKNERGGRIHVVGHASSRTQNTDPVNHKMINFRVSAARADEVARELQRLGVDRSQLQVDAVSDSAPEFLEVMPTGEAGNRRAEIYLDS